MNKRIFFLCIVLTCVCIGSAEENNQRIMNISSDSPAQSYNHLLQNKNSKIEPLELIRPLGGEIYSLYDTISIVWEFDLNLIGFVSVHVSLDSGKTWREIIGGIMNSREQAIDSIQWIPAKSTLPLLNKGLIIQVKDYAKNYFDRTDFFTLIKENSIQFSPKGGFGKLSYTHNKKFISFTITPQNRILFVSIVSLKGQILTSKTIPSNLATFTFPIFSFPSGRYAIHLSVGSEAKGHSYIFPLKK